MNVSAECILSTAATTTVSDSVPNFKVVFFTGPTPQYSKPTVAGDVIGTS